MKIEIPPGDCRTAYGGYPWTQLETIFPDKTFAMLKGWMYGQTMMLCDGSPEREWVHDESAPGGRYLVEVGPSKCGQAHGGVVYEWDLDRFLLGLPVVD